MVRTAGSTVWSPCVHDFFLPILARGHAGGPCLILLLFPYIRYSAVQYTHTHTHTHTHTYI